jgi:hypothetical protein
VRPIRTTTPSPFRKTSGGQEYRQLVHPFPLRKFDISYLLDNDKTYTELQGVYHRAHGRFAGFRVRCYDEWSSNGRVIARRPHSTSPVA